MWHSLVAAELPQKDITQAKPQIYHFLNEKHLSITDNCRLKRLCQQMLKHHIAKFVLLALNSLTNDNEQSVTQLIR